MPFESWKKHEIQFCCRHARCPQTYFFYLYVTRSWACSTGLRVQQQLQMERNCREFGGRRRGDFERLGVIKTEHGWGRGLAWLRCSCSASFEPAHSVTHLPVPIPAQSLHCPPLVLSLSAEVYLNLCTRCVLGSLLASCSTCCAHITCMSLMKPITLIDN